MMLEFLETSTKSIIRFVGADDDEPNSFGFVDEYIVASVLYEYEYMMTGQPAPTACKRVAENTKKYANIYRVLVVMYFPIYILQYE